MSHSVDPRRAGQLALVLGGGGAAGHAWTIGIVAGLAEAGLDLTEAADLVIGTSSGATAAAHLRSGIPPAELLAAVRAEPTRPAGAAPATAAVFERLRAIGAAATSAAGLRRALGAFGLAADAAFGPDTGARRAVVAARLPCPDWPDRPMIVVAVNAHTGEVAAFDRDSGVELADAITASTALPGLGPTHAIDGTHYLSGGVRSGANADLAAGYATVVVLSPFGGREWTAPLPGADSRFEGIRRLPGTDLHSELAGLRARGSHVELITADAGSVTAMGANQLDPATRVPSARAGFAQGLREFGRLGIR